MRNHKLAIAFALLIFALVPSAGAPRVSFAGPSNQVLIHNRARVYDNHVSGTGTRYFYVLDSALCGNASNKLLHNVLPTIAPNGCLRDVQVVVDLIRPLTLYADRIRAIHIGVA